MKNKKLLVTAIAAAIVLSMQATTVFAGEVSDSDLDPVAPVSTETDTTDADASLTAEENEDEETVGSDETSLAGDTAEEDEDDESAWVTDDEAYDDEAYDDEAYDDEAYDDEAYDDEAYDDEAYDDEADDSEEITDEEDWDDWENITEEDLPDAIEEYIRQAEKLPGTDEEEIAALRTLLEGTMTEIIGSERYTDSELTPFDVDNYLSSLFDEFVADKLDGITEGKCGENMTWRFDEESGVLTIAGSGDMHESYGEVDYEYTDWNACRGEVREVRFEGAITSIAADAFRNTCLTGITIPASVRHIGANALQSDSLESVTVDKDNADFCDVDGVLFSKDQKTLLYYPLNRKERQYTVPDTVTDIADSAFESAAYLTDVVIPDSVTSIGESAFAYCTHLTNVKVGDSVTKIKDHTFAQCVRLDNVTLGNSVQSIGNAAFGDSGLSRITIPHWVTKMSSSAFDAESLTAIDYIGTEEEWNRIVIDSMLLTPDDPFDGITVRYLPAASYTDPLPAEPDEEEDEWEDIVLDEEMMQELRDSFAQIIEEIESSEEIEPEQAEPFTALVENWIERLENDEDGVLTQKEATEFYQSFFKELYDLMYDAMETTGQCGDDLTWSFDRENGLLTIAGSGDMYDYFQSMYRQPEDEDETDGDEDAEEEVVIDADFEEIPNEDDDVFDEAFSFSVQDRVEEFFDMYIDEDEEDSDGEDDGEGEMDVTPWMMFTSLIKDVRFDGPITSIGTGAFMGCGFTGIEIPATVTRIGKGALEMNTRLKSIIVDKANEVYADLGGVLMSKDLTELLLYPAHKEDSRYEIPDSVKVIHKDAFSGAAFLTEIVVPDSVETLHPYAFQGCPQLRKITIGNGVKEIPEGAFNDCYKLRDVTLGNAVETIGDYAFIATDLITLTLPKSIRTISVMAFDDLGLTDVYYLGTKDEWAQVNLGTLEEDGMTALSPDVTVHVLGDAAPAPSEDTPEEPAKSAGETTDAGKTDAEKTAVSNTVENVATGEAAPTLPLLAFVLSAVSMALAAVFGRRRRHDADETL